ncbi:MAG: hypothetical protein EOL95_09420 [Bacteroidia bacterium]|nr:hypothetical protein [Bacteroidia bacterium]
MARGNYSKEINKSTQVLVKFRKDKNLFDNEKEILGLMQDRQQLYWLQVHQVLEDKKTEDSENEIQQRVKELVIYDLPICEIKIKNFQRMLDIYTKQKNDTQLNLCYQYLQSWLDLYEKDYALVAFRSLEHYARFWEWDFRDKDKVFKYSIDPMNDGGYTGVSKPFLYYFNQMVLKKKIKVITKQMMTGGGKTVSDMIAITWLYGIDQDNDVLKVLGNPTLVLNTTKGIVDTMTKKRYAMVFPKFQKYFADDIDPKTMFSICRIKDGELTLADSNKTLNLKVISKDTSIDGIRVRYLFLDDVCRSKDANNIKQHDTDIANFWNSWWKRNYNTDDFYIVAGGTAYSIYDILSTLKRYYSKGKVKKSPINKYTTMSLDESSVFISIPKLDPDTDESTYPQKFPTKDACAIRDRDYRMFMAMEQQQPLEPENSPFYWTNLKTYETIPEERSDSCWASIDPARIGFDNVAMSIFVKCGDFHFLKDVIYRNVPMEKVHNLIVDKIKQHHITKLLIERNTDTSLKVLLSNLLDAENIHYCEIIEIFSYIKKEERIYNTENSIKYDCFFPCENLYPRSSEMGKFMLDMISYRYDGKNEHDDSIDCVSLYVGEFIKNKEKKVKAKLLYI